MLSIECTAFEPPLRLYFFFGTCRFPYNTAFALCSLMITEYKWCLQSEASLNKVCIGVCFTALSRSRGGSVSVYLTVGAVIVWTHQKYFL